MRRYYEILGLSPGATEEQIKQAYRDMVKVWHPDRFSHDPKLQRKAEEKLKEINQAFEQLMKMRKNGQESAYGSTHSESKDQNHRAKKKSEDGGQIGRMKKIISITVVVGTLSIAYYFMNFIPQHTKETDLYKKMMDCRKMAEERYEKSKKDSEEAYSAGKEFGYQVDYQVHYNAKVNKCVYCESQYQSGKLGYRYTYYLIDLYTNSQLNTAIYVVESNLSPESKQYSIDEKNSFERYRAELFEERPVLIGPLHHLGD